MQAAALHAFDYLEISGSSSADDELIRDVRGRLRRSLNMVDAFLSIREGSDTGSTGERRYITGHQLCTILSEEVRTFETEMFGNAGDTP